MSSRKKVGMIIHIHGICSIKKMYQNNIAQNKSNCSPQVPQNLVQVRLPERRHLAKVQVAPTVTHLVRIPNLQLLKNRNQPDEVVLVQIIIKIPRP